MAKTELEEAGESTEGMAESTAKMRQEIMALSGVDIMLNENTFKSTYQIMDELAYKWQDLSDIAQASIIELMAGKHQGNVFASLMSNFDTAREALEVSANSAGSAMQEHAKWSQSLEARLLKLKATWQSLSQGVMSSDFLKVGLDIIIKFVDIIDALIDKLGVLPTLLIGFGIGKFAFNLLTMSGAMTGFKDILDVLIITFPKAAAVVSTFFTTLTAGGITLASVKAAFSGLWAVIAAHPILATIAALGIAFVAYNKLTESASELAERIEEVTTKYEEQHSAMMKMKGDYDTSNEDSLISKYGELSKGVDSLGKNVALTSDEYEEYRSIVDTIAGQMPSLVTGYNSQGDAILSCAGSVDKLAESYRNLIKEQNSEVLKTGSDIFKDYENDLKETAAYFEQSFTDDNGDLLDKFDTGHFDILKELNNLNGKELEKAVSDLSYSEYYKISNLLDKQGVKRDVVGTGDWGYETYQEHIIRAIKEDKSKIKSVLEDASADLNAYAEDLGSVTESYFSTAFLGGDDTYGVGDYSHLSEKLQGIITQVTSGLDSDFYTPFLNKENPYEALTKTFDSMMSAFDSLGTGEKKNLEAAFDLQTQFNGGKVSFGEYVKGIQDAGNIIDGLGLNEEITNQLKLTLNTEEVTENYDALKNRLTSDEYDIKMNASEAEEFLDGLTASEYAVAVDLMVNDEIDLSNFNADSLRKYIEDQAKLNDAMNFTIAIDTETESIEAFNTAMSESVSATGLSSASIESLKSRYAELAEQGYNLSSMFEETSNGIRLNREAVSEFEQALASQKLSEIGDENSGHLGVLKDRYDELTEEIKNCTDAGERASLYNEQQEVAQKINDLATLASQYEGLTSAYNAWQNAESAGNERDMYENILSGFETVEDELSRGWADDGTIKFLELMTGETDLAGKSAKELKEIWNGLDDTIKNTSYSVKDFFTTDEDGNSTSKGVYNFLDAVRELEKSDTVSSVLNKQFKDIEGIENLVTTDEDGNIIEFDFSVVGGDEAIADALGISEELVQIMLRAADDAGFVVTIDGKWTQLADLKTSAEESGNALKKLKSDGLDALKDFSNEDLTFNFDASSLEELNAEFEKANNVLDKFKDKNGKIKTDKNGNMVEGAKEALEVASYYQATIDKLTEPVYMQLETNQVEEKLQEPLTKMQEFERLSKEKHQLKLTGDTEGLKDVETKMNEIAKYLDGLDEETKIDLEIDGLSKEEIKSKLEKGEIEIPATVDIQLEMSEDIKDMRLLMMNQLGLVSDNEIKLKIGYEIDDSLVDKLDDEEKEVVIKYIEENEDAWNKLSEEDKEIFIDLVASGVDLETLTDDETKEVVIDFVTKNEDEFDKLTDEEKEVVVDIVANDSALKALEEHGVEIEAFCHIFGVEKVDDLKAKLDGLTDKQIQVLAQALGQINVEKLKTTVAGLDDKTVQAIAKALGEGDVNGLKTTINGLDDKTVQAIAKALGYSDVSELNSAIDNLDPKTVQAIAQTLGITDVDSLKAAIDRLSNKDVKAVANVDGTDDVKGLKSAIDNLKGKTITVWAQIKKKASDLWSKLTGGGGVDGTAHVNGTAFANGTTSGRAFKQGSWGTKNSGVALGGELAPELLVRDGRWHLIGEKGAEFFGYKKGDIIFNGEQTREIFEKGKITHGNGRGKALVSGTAFSKGTGGGFWENSTTTTTTTTTTTKSSNVSNNSKSTSSKSSNDSKSSSSKSSSSSSKEEKEFEETLDWIETAIDRIERAIDQLDKKTSSVYRTWSERNNALSSQISKVGDEIELQQKAYDRYIKEANSVGLDESWAKLVRDGAINIDTIKDEDLAEKIKNYTEWYEKALDCQDAILELQEAESELYAQRFEHVQSQYDGILQGYEHTEAMLNEYISQAEEKGYVISKKYYQALINNEKSNIAELKKQQADLIDARDEAVASGTIKKHSQEWYDMCASIDEVTQAIEEGTTALLEYNNAMREVDWSVFDLIQERISAVSEEADFLIELMSNDKLFDDNGLLTNQGIATMGLHGQKYNDYMYQADEYGAEASKLNAQIAKDPYDQELINRRNEVLELQRESILAAEDEKNAIRDMVEEGINLELDALQERIDLYNEAMDSAKDLYDYQKKVEEQTSEISDLRKQEIAYLGDTSEEGKAKLQEIRVSLEEAESDLEETEYDKYISDQAKLLDSLYVEYETILNTRLDNIDYLLEQMIAEINASALGMNTNITTELGNTATTIKTTLETEAKNVGTTLSTAMSNIWTVGDDNIKSVLSTYGKGFQDKQTTTNTELGKIKADVNAMVDDIDKDAKKKTTANKTTTSAKKNPTTSSSSSSNKNNTTKPTTTTNKTTSSGDGKPKVGDKVKFISGQYYYSPEGRAPLGSKYQGKEVYITNINTKSWATHPYHISTGKKLGSGDLGWLKLSQISGYASGKKNFLYDEVAWTQEGNKREFIVRPSDGAILTPVAKGDSILNANASSNIWDMANSPVEFIKNNLGLGNTNVPNGSNVNNNVTQHINVTQNFPNVKSYEETLTTLNKDPNFKRLINAMTTDQYIGKSSLRTGKAIR